MSAEIEIAAPAATAWAILQDLDRYGEWNPMTPAVRGRLATGQTLRLTAELGGFQRTQDQRVDELLPGRRMVWSGGLAAGLVRGTRTQTIEELGPERCRYRTDDRFVGPLAPATRATMTRVLNARFRAVAEALRDRAESWAAPRAADGRWVVAAGAGALPPGRARRTVVQGRCLWVWCTEGGRFGAVPDDGSSDEVSVLGEQLHTATGAWSVGTPGALPALQLGPVVLLWLHEAGAAPGWWPRLQGAWSAEEDWRLWRLHVLPVGAAVPGLEVRVASGARTLVLPSEPAHSPQDALCIGVAPPPRARLWGRLAAGGMGRLALTALRRG